MVCGAGGVHRDLPQPVVLQAVKLDSGSRGCSSTSRAAARRRGRTRKARRVRRWSGRPTRRVERAAHAAASSASCSAVSVAVPSLRRSAAMPATPTWLAPSSMLPAPPPRSRSPWGCAVGHQRDFQSVGKSVGLVRRYRERFGRRPFGRSSAFARCRCKAAAENESSTGQDAMLVILFIWILLCYWFFGVGAAAAAFWARVPGRSRCGWPGRRYSCAVFCISSGVTASKCDRAN